MVQPAHFTLDPGYAVANAPAMPAWNAKDAFARVRR
jgi:hypothetical protein